MRPDLLVRNCDRAPLYLEGHDAACESQLVESWNLVERGVAEFGIVLDLRPCQCGLMIIDVVDPPFVRLIRK